MSTRDERRRARRQAAAAVVHWLKGAEDIENRLYMAMRLGDLPNNQGHVPSATRRCGNCRAAVAVDIRLTALADKAKAIVCNHCVQLHRGQSMETLIMDQLNQDIGAEL